MRIYKYCLRLLMATYLGILAVVVRWGPSSRVPPVDGYDILLTGTFYSENWLIPHLQPLAGAPVCRRVRMVANTPVPDIPKVEAVYPPPWLSRIIGGVPARLMIFAWLSLRDRPEVVGGFHLLVNGLLAILLARLVGARSLYICGGGEREVLGGGYLTENRIFRRIGAPDAVVEKQLLAAVRYCDLIVVMGSKSKNYFSNHGVEGTIHIIPGGFDEMRFQPNPKTPEADLVTLGRLSVVKRVDLLLETLSLLQSHIPTISAVIVGDGPEKKALEQKAKALGIVERVSFVGHQSIVEEWLCKAKVFVLCSDSEGVSQAMIQAMLCGLPAIVSNVGDLADVVVDGENGFLICERTPLNFAECIEKLLCDQELRAVMSKEARKIAGKYGMAASSQKWEAVLTGRPTC